MMPGERGNVGTFLRTGGVRWDRRDWLLLAGLTALAAALRFYKLGSVPPGFQFDEAYNALDAAAVLEGARPLFLPLNGGREVLYTYLQAAIASVLGLSVYSLRLTSALAGIVTVPVCYILLRILLQKDSRRIAALTATVMAISFWHLHFSHYGIRVVLMPILLSGVCAFFWLGARKYNAWPYLLSGALAGLSVWSHPTGRLVPFVLALYTGWLLWQHPEARRFATRRPSPGHADAGGSAERNQQPLRSPRLGGGSRIYPPLGLVLAGLAAIIVFVPLGLEFLRHPDFFTGHASEVSVFTARVSQGSPLLALLRHGASVLGMFSLEGDRAWIHNLAGRPIFDPLLSIPFWIGIVIWILRLTHKVDPDRDALALLMLWSLVMLAPTVFSDDAPNFSRSLPALPALFLAAGVGLAALPGLLARLPFRPTLGRALGAGLIALILLASLGFAWRDYFVRFPEHTETYYAYDVDKLDAWSRLQPLMATYQVYLSQLWAEHATIAFLRRGTDVQSFDSSEATVLPPLGRGAVYAFPAQQHGRAERLAALWSLATVKQAPDRQGNPLLSTVTVDAQELEGWPRGSTPETPLESRFAEGPTLLGFKPEGRDLLLFWRAEAPMPRHLTAFVHLLDASGRRVGQADQVPGDGSFPTPDWTPGERVIERYRPVLDACLEDAPMKVVVGWYDLAAGGARLARDDSPGDSAVAGELSPYPVSSLPDQLQPPQRADKEIAPGLKLAGYGLEGQDLQPGSPFALDLYWAGDPSAAATPLSLELVPAGPDALQAFTLWQGTPVPPDSAAWRAGEWICRRLRLQVPPEAPSGAYRLALRAPGGREASIANLALGTSTRRFDLPPVERSVNARLGEAVRLVGADLLTGEPAGPITLTLVWQNFAPLPSSQTVFVHLLDAGGSIVAQSDRVPGSYPTDQWLPGEVVLDTHTLNLPAGLDPSKVGAYRLRVGMYDPLTGQRLAAVDADGQTIADGAVPLGAVAGR